MLSFDSIAFTSTSPSRSSDTRTACSDTGAESRLLEGMLRDEPEAWREFNAQFSRLIYRCITRVTARFGSLVGPDDVREIYAMLCLQLLAHDKRKLRSFEPERGNKLSSWLGMLAIHTAYDYLRGLKREPKRGALTEAETLTTDTPDPCEAYTQRERARLLSQLLSDLTEKDQLFVMLYYGEGLEPESVAERMGISVKTVYSKKHKIRSRLEALLSERQIAA